MHASKLERERERERKRERERVELRVTSFLYVPKSVHDVLIDFI